MIRIGSRRFDDFDEALDSINPAHDGIVKIEIEGEVEGQHRINKPNLIIRGGCFINNFGACDLLSDGEKRGTFRSYTLYVEADHVAFEGCEILNTAGSGKGQAIALMIDGDDIRLKDCKISSLQDTLFIGPLPEREYEPGGFKGPMERKPRITKHASFWNCLIEGSVDFIFGSGVGYFRGCTIRSLMPGYVLAPSTVPTEAYGFILDGCDLTGDMQEPSVYIARPWRPQAKSLLIDCRMGNHIRAEGYTDWGRDMSGVVFKEHNNSRNSTNYAREATPVDLKEAERYRKLSFADPAVPHYF